MVNDSIALIMLGSIMLSTRVVVAFQSRSIVTRQLVRPRAVISSSFVSTTWRQPFSGLLMTAIDEDETLATKSFDSTWNIQGLKKEVARLVMRSHKKLGKANSKLTKAQELVDKLTGDPDVTLEELDKCPNVDAIELELEEMRARLQGLNQLEELLAGEKKKKGTLPEPIVSLALDLGVNDAPPPRQPRGPSKKKGPRQVPRVPYRRYFSPDKTEIRVSIYFG